MNSKMKGLFLFSKNFPRESLIKYNWRGMASKHTLTDYSWSVFWGDMLRIWVPGVVGMVFFWYFIPISDFLHINYGFPDPGARRPNEQGWNEMIAKGLFVLGAYSSIKKYLITKYFLKNPRELKIPHEFSRLFFLRKEKPNIKLGNNLHPVYDTEFSGVKRVIGLSGTQVKNYFLELAMVDELPDPQAFKRALYEEGKVVFIDLFLYCIKTRWGEIRLHGPAFDQKPNPALTWVIEAPTEMVREHADGKGKWELRFE